MHLPKNPLQQYKHADQTQYDGTHLDNLVPTARDDDRVQDVRAEADTGDPDKNSKINRMFPSLNST